MRILHTESSFGWGGQEIRIFKESLGLRKNGHEVIFAIIKNGKLVDKLKKEGFIVYEINFRKSNFFLALYQLIRIIKRHNIDIINTHSSNDSWIGGIAGRLTKIKIIRTRHLSTPVKGKINAKLLYGLLCDFVVTTCSSIIPKISNQSGKPLSRFLCIASGVDVSKVSYEKEKALSFREKYNVKPDDILIGTACFMRSWKGIDDFLKAADLLREENNIKWVIIGGGHEKEYREKASLLNLPNLVFTGHLNYPYEAIGALDIFALLSTAHEGISQASLQAAYFKKPLITTKTGGLPEVCVDGKTGINVTNFSPNEVVQAVLKLKNSRKLRDQYGEEGKKLVLKNFTFERTIIETEKVYLCLEN